MRLTLHTDYALRALLYLAAAGDAGGTAQGIADSYGISRNHLSKVLQRLGALGYLTATRGRGGGVKLARAPGDIRVGTVVRQTEDSLAQVECFDPERNTCPLIGACSLERGLGEALDAYLAVLDRYTIADVALDERGLKRLFG